MVRWRLIGGLITSVAGLEASGFTQRRAGVFDPLSGPTDERGGGDDWGTEGACGAIDIAEAGGGSFLADEARGFVEGLTELMGDFAGDERGGAGEVEHFGGHGCVIHGEKR